MRKFIVTSVHGKIEVQATFTRIDDTNKILEFILDDNTRRVAAFKEWDNYIEVSDS